MPWIATALLFLGFCGDHRRMRRVSELRERPFTEPCGWSEDKARQYSVPERHNFGPFVRRHGFGLM